MKLFLDGVLFLDRRLQKITADNNPSCIKKHLWNRISIIFQTIFSLAYCVVLQTLRAASSLIGGLFTLDGHKIGDGIKDIASLIFQVVALPVIGLIACFELNPGSNGRIITRKLCGKDGNIEDRGTTCQSVARKIVMFLIRGVFAFPVGIATGVIKGISAVFSADGGLFFDGVRAIKDGIISPIYGLFYSCLKEKQPILNVLNISTERAKKSFVLA